MDAYKIWEFRKNCANEWPLRGKFITKIRNFDSFGGCIPTFLPHGEAPPCQISRLSGQRVAPAGQKAIFGLLSKNNTGMAALRAGLPVTKSKILHWFYWSACLAHQDLILMD